MKKNNFFRAGMAAAALTFGLVLAGCPAGESAVEPKPEPAGNAIMYTSTDGKLIIKNGTSNPNSTCDPFKDKVIEGYNLAKADTKVANYNGTITIVLGSVEESISEKSGTNLIITIPAVIYMGYIEHSDLPLWIKGDVIWAVDNDLQTALLQKGILGNAGVTVTVFGQRS